MPVLMRAAGTQVFSFGGGHGVRMGNHGFAWTTSIQCINTLSDKRQRRMRTRLPRHFQRIDRWLDRITRHLQSRQMESGRRKSGGQLQPFRQKTFSFLRIARHNAVRLSDIKHSPATTRGGLIKKAKNVGTGLVGAPACGDVVGAVGARRSRPTAPR